eukprot:4823611-Karenia_brevis.AAC.1
MDRAGKRPNRSAAERRQQHQRATTRAFAKLVEHAGSLQHRGSSVPQALSSSMQSFSQPTRALDIHSLEQQLAGLEALLLETNSQVQANTATLQFIHER